VVNADCRGYRICFCVIVIFICESSACYEDRLQGIKIYFCVIVMFSC
jgi:hypothetical protein